MFTLALVVVALIALSLITHVAPFSRHGRVGFPQNRPDRTRTVPRATTQREEAPQARRVPEATLAAQC
jgi:hypothetical protein